MSIHRWMDTGVKKIWYTHAHGILAAVTKSEMPPLAAPRTDLETQAEWRGPDRETDAAWHLSDVEPTKRCEWADTRERNEPTDTRSKLTGDQTGKAGGTRQEHGINRYTLLLTEQLTVRIHCVTQGTVFTIMWSALIKNLKRVCIYIRLKKYTRITLLYTRN